MRFIITVLTIILSIAIPAKSQWINVNTSFGHSVQSLVRQGDALYAGVEDGGVYLYRLQAGERSEIRKMTLLK